MSSFSSPDSSVVRSASSLQRRFLLGAGMGGTALILLMAWGVDLALDRYARRETDARLMSAVQRAQALVTQALADRERQVAILAYAPAVVEAARQGNERASSLGLAAVPQPDLERRFDADRSLQVAPVAHTFLVGVLPRLDAAEISVTEQHGFNAVTTVREPDFVQSDEPWWRAAWQDGTSTVGTDFDSTSRKSYVTAAAVIKEGETRIGVLSLSFQSAPFVAVLAQAGDGIRVDVVDSTNRIVLSSDTVALGHYLTGLSGNRASQGSASVFDAGSERAIDARINRGRWRLLAHQSSSALNSPYRSARGALASAVAVLLVILFGVLVAVHQFLARRISGPATELAVAAEAVAAGDFSVQIAHASADDEIGRLGRAIAAMILELRRLAHALAGSALETTNMSAEITAGSEEMAATAGEIANTASDLSAQATTMAESIASLAQSASSLRELATTLDDGARGGVARNESLRALASENRAGLDASTASLTTLSVDVADSAAAIESLGAASEEIRTFVGLVRKLARQSKLLALNAAMEAARAGEHGEGFAVVASEVRRLAAMSSDAAERTEEIVGGVLSAIQQSRESAARAVTTAEEVRAATARATDSFTEIEMAVVEAEAWTASVEQTSAETSALVENMTARLDSLAAGTESFAAAMEQVAASSQEQSASTQEIAGAAATLASAADRLSKLVANLRLGQEVSPAAAKTGDTPAPVRLATSHRARAELAKAS
ncbi:MAG TPA: methyl-accepting chemotaxis protein [Gemmatimonadaceae bacterium]|jgi:methyl-accepting chemotaxis protein|nr:methyl-accepting chemotaxis protein [Gemmatimonadaceae bacterium]